jgi:PAS domain S-box-containing protein
MASTGKALAAKRRRHGSIGPAGVLTAGAVLVVLLLLLLAAFGVYERNERVREETQRLELLARLLEEHATAGLDAASRSLAMLAEARERAETPADAQQNAMLALAAAGVPALRSMQLLDAQGQVLASSVAGERERWVELKRLGLNPAPGAEAMGGFVAGGEQGAGASGAGALPLLRKVQTKAGQTEWLAVWLDLAALQRQMQRTLGETYRTALLASLDGVALASTSGAALAAGEALPALPMFRAEQRAGTQGSYLGAGTRHGEQFVAYRFSATRPVAVLVEAAQDDVLAAWQRQANGLMAVAALLTLLIAALTMGAARSVRSRAAARRQREAALAQTAMRERELNVVVRSVQEMLFRADSKGRLIFINNRWRAVSQRPEAQALGRTLAELVRPESAEEAAALFSRDGASGVRSARVLLGPPEDVRLYELAVAPLRSKGVVAGFAGSATDVTAQQQEQAALRAQVELAEMLLEVLPLPVAVLDVTGHVVSVNRAWEACTGLTRQQSLGQAVRDLLPAAESGLHEAHDATLLAQGGSVRYPADLARADAPARPIAIVKAAVPDAQGLPGSILMVLLDPQGNGDSRA